MFALHRWAGLLTGVLFFVTAVTGFLLLFTEDANLMGRPAVPVGTTPANLAPALAAAAEAAPGYALTSVRIAQRPDHAWIAFLRHPDTNARLAADLDPYTGTLLGIRDYGSAPFRVLLDLHYTYYAGTIGKIASTCVGAALVLLAISGLWLYRGAIRDLFRWRVRRGATTRATLIWLHKWTGLWTLALALTWGSTGLVFMSSILPAAFSPAKKNAPADPVALRAMPDTSALLAAASAAFPLGTPHSLTPPGRKGSDGARIRVLLRHNPPWAKFGEVRFATDGQVVKITRPEEQSLSDKFHGTVTALHFGFLGHRLTLILYWLGGAVMIFLPVSGYAIWWLKRRSARR